MKKILPLLLLLLFLSGFLPKNARTDYSKLFAATISNSNQNAEEQTTQQVSIIQLIANPEAYHNKQVSVIGIGNLEFERNSLYYSKEDCENFIFKNGVWIELGENATPYEEAVKYNGKYVIVVGTYDMYQCGHFGMYSGSIVNIIRYDLWE